MAKTLFVLHGGTIDLSCYQNFHYWRKLAALDKHDLNVLSISFAATLDAETAEGAARFVQSMLSFVNPNKTFTTEPAIPHYNKIREQIAAADIIYVHGGDRKSV